MSKKSACGFCVFAMSTSARRALDDATLVLAEFDAEVPGAAFSGVVESHQAEGAIGLLPRVA